jgi:hypothetical protein
VGTQNKFGSSTTVTGGEKGASAQACPCPGSAPGRGGAAPSSTQNHFCRSASSFLAASSSACRRTGKGGTRGDDHLPPESAEEKAPRLSQQLIHAAGAMTGEHGLPPLRSRRAWAVLRWPAMSFSFTSPAWIWAFSSVIASVEPGLQSASATKLLQGLSLPRREKACATSGHNRTGLWRLACTHGVAAVHRSSRC